MFERVCSLIGEMTHRNEYCDFCSDRNSAWCNENYCKMAAFKSLPIIIWVEILQMHFLLKPCIAHIFVTVKEGKDRCTFCAISAFLLVLSESTTQRPPRCCIRNGGNEDHEWISAKWNEFFFHFWKRNLWIRLVPIFCRLKRFWSRVHRNTRAMMKWNETIFRNIVIFCTRIC